MLSWRYALGEKCPNTELFLVRIFPHSEWIQRDRKYLRIHASCRKIRTRNNSVFGHFTQWYRKIIERKLISENLAFVDGHLAYNWKRKVTFDNDRKRIIIQEVYEGLENDPKAKNFAGHCGRESTYQNLDKRHGSGPIDGLFRPSLFTF